MNKKKYYNDIENLIKKNNMNNVVISNECSCGNNGYIDIEKIINSDKNLEQSKGLEFNNKFNKINKFNKFNKFNILNLLYLKNKINQINKIFDKLKKYILIGIVMIVMTVFIIKNKNIIDQLKIYFAKIYFVKLCFTKLINVKKFFNIN